MTEDDRDFLLSPRGTEALAAARDLLAVDPLAAVTAMRRQFSRDESFLALHQAWLRERARAKFSRAEEMFFDREALEQATGEQIARWRARRYAGHGWVADLCCGLGGDALALAEKTRVIAVDHHASRLALLHWNARVYEVEERVFPLRGTVPSAAPRLEAAFADPSRRVYGPGGKVRRTRSLTAMSPPFAEVLALTERIPQMGIKLSPALDDAELEAALAGRPHELEFISDGGECREAVLWLGGLVTAARRATVLPAGETRAVPNLSDTVTRGAAAPLDIRADAVRGPGEYLFEPDPAVIRAHLIEQVASEMDAWALDPQIAYLSANRLVRTPLATVYRIREAMPFHLRRVAEALAARGYGDVVVKKRGFPAEPDAIRRQLRPHLRRGQGGEAVLFLTRVGEKHLAIIAEKV
jgi:hypothetical protein